MKDLFYIEQHKRFPEIVNAVIVANKELSAIPVYNYDGVSDLLFTKDKHTYTPFYIGFIPRTYDEEHVVPTFIYTGYKLPLFSIVEVKPLFYVKFVADRLYNIVVGTLLKEEYNLAKEQIKQDIMAVFGTSVEGLIIESEYKAKAYLIHANKFFERRFILVKKK